jgi:hypothetical protein
MGNKWLWLVVGMSAAICLVIFILTRPAAEETALPEQIQPTATELPTIFDLQRQLKNQPVPASRPEPTTPTGWKKYTNYKYGFSVYTPPDLSMEQTNEGANTYTITLQNPEAGVGFQIYATPYTHDFITENRLKQDLPSGVVTEQTEILIDGERAVAFFSADPRIGETREVWFIYDGILYEITTLRPLDEWLATVMSTWRFLDK